MPCAVILTALSVEYLAVRDHLTNLRERTHPQGTIYEWGQFVAAEGQVWEVSIVEIGAGNAGAALEAERAIAYFSPNVVLFVGVAGGLKDVVIGDVVASTKIYGYESGKAEQKFKPRPEIGLPSYSLEQRARAEARKEDWLKRLTTIPGRTPRVFLAPIAAGEKVIASTESEVLHFLRANYGDTVAVEMEGLGFLEAARANQSVLAMVIRGISDLIDGKETSDKAGSQQTASCHASAFAFAILANLKLEDESVPKDRGITRRDGMVQNNADNAKSWQTVVQGGTAYIGEIHIHESIAKSHEYSSHTHTSSQLIPSVSLGTLNNLPRSGVIDFCGRQQVQSQIHEQFNDDNSPFKTLAIVGMGGIGKTEIALQYAFSNFDVYSGGICWIYGKNQDIASQIIGFSQIYLQIDPSKDLSPEDRVKFCWNYWSHNKSLIIFDDISSYESVKLFLPPNEPRFRVLLTSRFRLGSSIKHIPVDTLNEAAAIAVLKSLTSEERIQQELMIAKQICNWLGYLPLGLELVGRYLSRRSELSLMLLQQRLEDKKLLARAISQTEEDMTRPISISATFELSWDELSKEAKSLAYALCLFASSPIPWKLVQQCFTSWDTEDLEDLREESLLSSHLLHRNGNDEFRLHQLVREFFREKSHEIEQASEIQRFIANGLSLLAKEIPESLTQVSILQLGAMIPHITEVIVNLSSHVDNNYFTYPFQGVGRYFEGQGFYTQAEEVYSKCFDLTKEKFGDRHINTICSMSSLASTYYIQGRYAEAETFQREALSIKISDLGEEHPEVADLMNNLALTLEEEDNYTEAEDLYIRSMNIRNNFLGRRHADFTDSLNNLAVLYDAQGRHGEAEQLLLEALHTRKAILGEQHPRVATSLNNLASCYYNQHRLEDAEKLYSDALILYKDVHQRKHPDIAIALSNLAQVYSERKKYLEAVPLLQEALDIQESVLGPEHPDVAMTLNNLASLYEDLERIHDAEELYGKVLAMRRRLLGDESIDLAISLNNLAKFFYTNERYIEAEPLYLESLGILHQKLEMEHPLIEKISANLNELRLFLIK